MTGLVLFLHGLTGDQSSWGAVPDYVRDSPLGNDFQIATPEYSASLLSPSTIEVSARQILTFIETKYPESDPIFLVGYSLGGLIAREICRLLLVLGPDELLNKISAVITAGTPLEGARMGNAFLQWIPLLSPKIRELAKPKQAFAKYRQAIRKADERKVRRPKRFHIQIEDDRVIKAQLESHFTQDDVWAAVIPGGHMNFSSSNEDASYVANVLLLQIRKAYNATSRPDIKAISQPTTKASEPTRSVELPDHLILIACSHGKRDGGQTPFRGPAPGGWIPEHGLRQRMISKRAYVYSLLHDAKLADGFERGGNRAHQPANIALKQGPDLGGTSVIGDEGAYYPASKRYNGRGYVPVSAPAWEAVCQHRQQFRILIMSGLYGLIEPNEWIQNYDVHLTDTNQDNGQSISSIWTEIFTECIDSYIRHAYRNRKVKIINFLCDQHYVNAVQWHVLSKDATVLHLTSPTLTDTKLLPPAGLILNSILLDPEWFERLEQNSVYQLSDFGLPPAGLAGTEIVLSSRAGA